LRTFPVFSILPGLLISKIISPAWAVSRQAIKDDEIGGYFVPANSTIFLSIYAMHRDERYWDNPDQFIPERFEPSRFGADQKKSYLPFGTGARICIGNNFALLEMQLVLAALYSNFNFKITPGFIPALKTPVTLRFKNDIFFQIEKI
jgi:cytochrome P450